MRLDNLDGIEHLKDRTLVNWRSACKCERNNLIPSVTDSLPCDQVFLFDERENDGHDLALCDFSCNILINVRQPE